MTSLNVDSVKSHKDPMLILPDSTSEKSIGSSHVESKLTSNRKKLTEVNAELKKLKDEPYYKTFRSSERRNGEQMPVSTEDDMYF